MSIVSRTAFPSRASRRGCSGPWRATEGVDGDLRLPRLPAQVLVVLRLHPDLADLVAGPVELRSRVELLLGDLAHVAEDLGRERLVGVVAQEGALDLDSGELRLVLVQVVDLILAHRRLHRDRVDGIGEPLVDLLREDGGLDVQNLGEPLDHVVPAALLREVADPELHGRARDVVDDHPAAPVEDRAARGLDPDRAQLVSLRIGQVLLTRQNLQRPEPEEEDGEDGEGDDAEDADPEGKSGRQPIRRLDAGIRREEARRRGASLTVRRVRAHSHSSTRRTRSYGTTSARSRRQRRCSGRTRAAASSALGRTVTSAVRAETGWPSRTWSATPADERRDRERECRERRRIRTAAPRRLPVPPCPVPDEDQDDRRRPEGPERHHVDEQPAGEARDRAGERPCHERQRDDRDEQEIGLGAEDTEAADRRDLDHRRDEDERRDPERDAHRSPRSRGRRTSTASSEPRSANGVTCTWV